MAKLADNIKEFIVIALACYDTPSQIVKAVKEEFKLEIPRQQVEEYDPMKRCKTAKWVDLHREVRAAFLRDLSSVPASKKAVRVRRLALMAERAEGKGNVVVAAQLYEQIAKEMGEAYTNRRVIVPANPLDELAKAIGVTADQLAMSLELTDVAGAAGAIDGSEGA